MRDLMKDLAEVVREIESTKTIGDEFLKYLASKSDGVLALDFIRTNHATIQQNAEAALRLRALEQAMDERKGSKLASTFIRQRADELLREWAKEKGDE